LVFPPLLLHKHIRTISAYNHRNSTLEDCSGKLWRSEKEPSMLRMYAPTGNDGDDFNKHRSAWHLQQDIPRRAPEPSLTMDESHPWDTRCNHQQNCMFKFRNNQELQHDEEVAKHTKRERPDHVYGLDLAGELPMLLQQPSGLRNLSVLQRLTPYGCKQLSDQPPILPFLLLESKVENYKDLKTYYQSGFGLRSLLILQQNLRRINVAHTESEVPPLVWYFSHHGPTWKLSAAYVHHDSQYVSVWLLPPRGADVAANCFSLGR
jgi:hypothetical protein